MKTNTKNILIGLALLGAATINVRAAAYTFTPLSVTGPETVHGTIATGISGDNVVGYYYGAGWKNNGFVFDGTSYTTLNNSLGTYGTRVWGVSGGNIVGDYDSAAGPTLGFRYNGTSFTTIAAPASSTMTTIHGVSGNTAAGYYTDTATGKFHGFLYNGSSYTTIDNPLAGALGTTVLGISGDQVVGYYYDNTPGSNPKGYLYDGTKVGNARYSPIDVPSANGTYPNAVFGSTVVGRYFDSDWATHGFLYDSISKIYTTLDCPLGPGPGTEIIGIDGSTLVGTYLDSGGNNVGFIATSAVPEPGQWAMMGVTFVGVAGFVIRQRRAKAAAR